jgi:lipid A 3-O-deacylase
MYVLLMLHRADTVRTVGGSKWRRWSVVEHIDCAMLASFLVLTFCLPGSAAGSELASALEIQVDSLDPTKSDRRLETINVHALLGEKRIDARPLAVRFGLTLSRVTGFITQLEGDFNRGTLHEQTSESSAWGIGPVVQQRVRVLGCSVFTLRTDFGEGALWYNRAFPHGGRRYNFMLQAGPTIGYAPATGCLRVSIGYRWMHVSNGSGLGPQNPSYGAAGVMLGLGCALRTSQG